MSLFTKILKITSHFQNIILKCFLGSFKMALLKHFKWVDAKKLMKIGIVLPKPDGPLLSVMPSSSIESANVAVIKAMLTASLVTMEGDKIDDYKRCDIYQQKKLKLGKRTAELGISSTVRYFTAKPGEERTLSPSTLFAWKGKYLDKLKQRSSDEDSNINELSSKKQVRNPAIITWI